MDSANSAGGLLERPWKLRLPIYPHSNRKGNDSIRGNPETIRNCMFQCTFTNQPLRSDAKNRTSQQCHVSTLPHATLPHATLPIRSQFVQCLAAICIKQAASAGHISDPASIKQDSQARVAELADAQDLKSCVLTDVRVQVPPRVLRFLPFHISFALNS